jgi:hypothetical protein
MLEDARSIDNIDASHMVRAQNAAFLIVTAILNFRVAVHCCAMLISVRTSQCWSLE